MHLSLKRYLALLVMYLKPQWWRVLLMTVSLLAGTGLQLLSPQILRYFIDTATNGGVSVLLIYAGVIFIGVTLLSQGTAIATSYLSENVAWTATNQLRTDLVAHCLSLDMAFHKARTPGELIERIDGDVDTLSNFFSQFVINLLGSVIMLLGILILFFLIDWRVGVVMTAFSITVSLILMYLNRRSVPLWKNNRQVIADLFGFLGEHLAGTEDMRANGATSFVMCGFYLLSRRWLPINRKALLASNLMGATTLLLFICGSGIALSLGAYLWSTGAITVGTVYLMFAYTDRLSQPINQLQEQLQDFQQATACIQRIEELLHTPSALKDGSGTPLPAGAFSVDFHDVTFGYAPDELVLHHLTFHVQPGKVLGVLGRTGSGKTTLARLLFRLYDPQSGKISLGDVPIQTASLRDARKRIGMVTQDIQLFHASVRDNLTFFDRTIEDALILEVLDMVGLTSWYNGLPKGLDTELGADGEGISAGEAQLLAFTRIFLTNPGLVILDEASSRLDPATESLIEQAVSKLFTNRTGIIIAHRLSTIQRADEIMVLEDGQIVEYGARDVLATDPTSRFYQLLQTGLEEVRA
ncbi:MAG TPA: ABC transporter ATP-binding protein [Ktedonobacteraceae bacterium]|nr:ABC transporter ATP-binding protein [Ktedonobacteraceae bacterium]